MVGRRPGQILERHDQAEDSTLRLTWRRHADAIRPTSVHYGCPTMTTMIVWCRLKLGLGLLLVLVTCYGYFSTLFVGQPELTIADFITRMSY